MKKTILLRLMMCLGSIGAFTTPVAGFSPPPSLEVKSSHGISYLSGGVGEEEREALQLLGQSYPLKLLFAEREGNYLSDVTIAIRDQSGRNILEEVVEGPWFFANLSPGQYEVNATIHGITRQQHVRVAAGQQRQLAFYW